MAKKLKVRWGEKPIAQKIPALDEFKTRKLASLIGLAEEKQVTDLLKILNAAARNFKSCIILDSREMPGEVCAALTELSGLLSSLKKKLSGLPPVTEKVLKRAYRDCKLFHWEESLRQKSGVGIDRYARDISHVRRLQGNILVALREHPKDRGGKPDQSNLDWLVQQLSEIFEEFAGQPFKGPLSSKAGKELPGKFVRDAVSIIAPGSEQSAVDTAMRRAVSALKKDKMS